MLVLILGYLNPTCLKTRAPPPPQGADIGVSAFDEVFKTNFIGKSLSEKCMTLLCI